MDLDSFQPELIWPYDPRLTPQRPPSVGVCEGPMVTICMSDQWWAHVSGMIMRLTYRDAWTGTDDEVHDAIESVYKILDVGKPTMSCGCEDKPNRTRYTDDWQYQVSYDGGVTWVDASDQDPRYTAPLMPKLPGDDGDAKRCQAAANVTFHFQAHATQLENDATLWANIQTLIAAFVGLLIFLSAISLGTLTPILLGVGAALLSGGQAAFTAAMTADVWVTFNCIIYCHMDEEGRLDSSDMDDIFLQINTQLSGIAAVFLAQTCWFMGVTGLNNMAATSTGVDADCLDCGCDEGCSIDDWEAGFWNDGTYYPPPDPSHAGTETGRGSDWITIQSHDRGDGQQIMTLTTPNGETCCGFSFEWVGTQPAHALFSFNHCDQHANYQTLIPDGTAPFSQPFTMVHVQCDPGTWTGKFTITP